MMKWGIDKMNWDINYIEQEGIKLQNKKEKWIEQRIEMGGEKKSNSVHCRYFVSWWKWYRCGRFN